MEEIGNKMKKLNLKLITNEACLEKLNKPLTVKFTNMVCCDFEGTLLEYAEFFRISIHKYKYLGEVNPQALIFKAVIGNMKIQEPISIYHTHQTIIKYIKIRAVHLNDTVKITIDNIEIK